MKPIEYKTFQQFLFSVLAVEERTHQELLDEYRTELGKNYSKKNTFGLKDGLFRKIYRKAWEQAGKRDFARGAISVQPEVGVFLYVLTRLLQPETVVETGTSAGYSATHFATAMEKNGFGKVITTDISPKAGWGIPPSLLKARIRIFAGNDPLSLLAKNAPDGIDVFFHDSDHSYENVKKELKIVLPKISESGIVVSHDACRKTESGPFRAFSELKDWQVFFIDPENIQGTAFAAKNIQELKKRISDPNNNAKIP